MSNPLIDWEQNIVYLVKGKAKKKEIKKFSEQSPCELVRSNMDRGCGLDGCPQCGEIPITIKGNNYTKWLLTAIVSICNAPFVGGIAKDRPLAIVYECSKCFEYSWFHTTESHKETLEELLNEGVI